jgi:hypothetical protein
MGVYTSALALPTLPIVLPKLSLGLWLVSPKDQPFSQLSIRIARDDGFLIAELRPDVHDINFKMNNESITTRQFIFVCLSFGNIELPVGCKYLSTFIETESEILESSKLHIQVTPGMFQQVNQVPPVAAPHDAKK